MRRKEWGGKGWEGRREKEGVEGRGGGKRLGWVGGGGGVGGEGGGGRGRGGGCVRSRGGRETEEEGGGWGGREE